MIWASDLGFWDYLTSVISGSRSPSSADDPLEDVLREFAGEKAEERRINPVLVLREKLDGSSGASGRRRRTADRKAAYRLQRDKSRGNGRGGGAKPKGSCFKSRDAMGHIIIHPNPGLPPPPSQPLLHYPPHLQVDHRESVGVEDAAKAHTVLCHERASPL